MISKTPFNEYDNFDLVHVLFLCTTTLNMTKISRKWNGWIFILLFCSSPVTVSKKWIPPIQIFSIENLCQWLAVLKLNIEMILNILMHQFIVSFVQVAHPLLPGNMWLNQTYMTPAQRRWGVELHSRDFKDTNGLFYFMKINPNI